jgi:protochlorophyllide reductase
MYDGKPVKKCCTYFLGAPFFYLMTKTPYQGTQTSLHCCLMPFDFINNGAYYADCKVKKETLKPEWKDQMKKLWEWSVEATKDYTN